MIFLASSEKLRIRKNLPVLDMDRVDKNSSEANEKVCDRMTEKKRRSLEFFDHNIPRKKRRQTLLRANETSPCINQFYQTFDYMLNQVNAVLAEEAKVRVASKKRLGFLLEEVDKQLKEINGTKKKSYYSNFAELGFNSNPELPADLREVVKRKGGDNLKLVITKPIYATDLNKINNRFQIPVKQIVCSDFLSQKEKVLLKQTHEQNTKEKRKGGMDVTILIEPSFEEHNLRLREWPMKNTNNYVLVSGWNSAIKNEKESGMIQERDMVQLWSFRCRDKLWFLLHKVRGLKHN